MSARTSILSAGRIQNGEEAPPVMPDSVWYAVYGSNLLRSRFRQYLERCPDGTREHDDIPLRIPFRLYFAHERSRNWGPGGVAFVEPVRAEPPPTLGRAYLLTLRQFAYVVGGENGRTGPIQISPEMIGSESPVPIPGAGWYGVLLPFDHLRGVRVVTITRPNDLSVPRTSPGSPYQETIRSGLHETYPDMNDEEIDNYVLRFTTET